jgi:hypothetical protein
LCFGEKEKRKKEKKEIRNLKTKLEPEGQKAGKNNEHGQLCFDHSIGPDSTNSKHHYLYKGCID